MNRPAVLAALLAVAASNPAWTQDSFGGSRSTPPPAATPPAATSRQPEAAPRPSGNAAARSGAAAAAAPLHSGPMHGQTPAGIAGGQVISTQALSALMRDRQSPFVLFDVLGGQETLPSALPAAWMSEPGTYSDGVQQRVAQALQQATQGRKEVALVFYCASEQCWMSYNAALRAISAGYTNVRWYRGGLESWKAAGLPTQPAARY